MSKVLDFELVGKTAIAENNLAYLKIDDQIIHQLFPLLPQINAIRKPDYFGAGLVGAHISIIYPEEKIVIAKSDLGQMHQFEIKGFYQATLGVKNYYVVMVKLPALVALRKKYGLPEYLCFKNYMIDFHITFGVEV